MVSIQEVHGTPDKIAAMLHPLKKHFYFFHSFMPTADSPLHFREDCGSVLTLIPRATGVEASTFNFDSSAPVPGRVLEYHALLATTSGSIGMFTTSD